jgi:hypothetical protein
MASSGLLRRAALARTDVSEELSASFIRVTRIGELGTTLACKCNVINRSKRIQKESIREHGPISVNINGNAKITIVLSANCRISTVKDHISSKMN